MQPGEPIPTGPEWGYAGSGPAQLALALAADVLGDDQRAQEAYQRLKFRVAARLNGDRWEPTREAVLRRVAEDEGADDAGAGCG